MPCGAAPDRGQRHAAAAHHLQVTLPCREAVLLALQRVQACAELMAATARACLDAARRLLAQVAASFFVPLCIAAASLAARLRVMACARLLALVQAHQLLFALAVVCPLRRPAQSGVGADVPCALSVTWAHGTPTLLALPCAAGARLPNLAAQAALDYGVLQSAGTLPSRDSGVHACARSHLTVLVLL